MRHLLLPITVLILGLALSAACTPTGAPAQQPTTAPPAPKPTTAPPAATPTTAPPAQKPATAPPAQKPATALPQPAGGAQQVSVQASEFKFEPATVTVRANQPVSVTLRNTGSILHDWTVEGLDQPVHIEVEAGQTKSSQFTPKAGTFRLICTQAGHEQAGMAGQLVVQ